LYRNLKIQYHVTGEYVSKSDVWALEQPCIARARRPNSIRCENEECPFPLDPAPAAAPPAEVLLPWAAAAAEAIVVGGAASSSVSKSAVAVTTEGTDASLCKVAYPNAATLAHTVGEVYKFRHALTKSPALFATI